MHGTTYTNGTCVGAYLATTAAGARLSTDRVCSTFLICNGLGVGSLSGHLSARMLMSGGGVEYVCE